MPENRKSAGNSMVSFGMNAAIVIAVSAFLLACSQSTQESMVGYWTPGNSCDRQFFELTTDSKFYQWTWEKNWDGYSKVPGVKPSNYVLSDKNEITISSIDKKGRKQKFTGKIEQISKSKIKIVNVKMTRDNQTVKNAPPEINLTRCEGNIAELLKK